MNAIALTEVALTMSSREIAALCEKEHKDVMRDIRNMLEQLGETLAQFCADLPDAYGRLQPVYNLPKDLTLTLVAGYNVKLRKRIIDRWLELEAKVSAGMAVIPQTLPEALRLAADMAEQKAKAETALAIAAPKAEALDRIADAEGTMNPTVAAKALQIQPKKLFDFLRDKHWIYRRPGGSGNVAYQDKIQAGYLTHKITTVQRDDGTDKVVEQVLVTAKGLAKLSQTFGHRDHN